MTKQDLHSVFIKEFESFLKVMAQPDQILTTRMIKGWVKDLDNDHPLKFTFREYVNQCNQNKGQVWQLNDYNKITIHMKHIPGYYQTVSYKRRVGSGPTTKFVTVKQNKIKII